MADEAQGWAPQKLTLRQAREEQGTYWAGKSVQERLAGAQELKRQWYLTRGIDVDKLQWDWNPRFVKRPKLLRLPTSADGKKEE